MMSKEQAMAMVLAKYELFPDSNLKPESVWRSLTRETRKTYRRKATMAMRDLHALDMGFAVVSSTRLPSRPYGSRVRSSS